MSQVEVGMNNTMMTGKTVTKDREQMQQEEGKNKKMKWPRQVYFILCSKAAERFCFYGILTILNSYFKSQFMWNGEKAGMMGRAFSFAINICPLFGAYLADTTIGKYTSIMGGSMIYVVGTILLAVSALYVQASTGVTVAMLSIILCGLGAGGINATVTSFGADQFDMLCKKETQESYFAWNYCMQNVVATIAFAISPYIRDYDEENPANGFLVIFLLCAFTMAISIILLFVGNKVTTGYIQNPLGQTLLAQIFRPMRYLSMTNRYDENKMQKAMKKFGELSIKCALAMYEILPVFMFLPLFWITNDLQYDQVLAQANLTELNQFIELKNEFTGTFSGLFIVAFTLLFDRLYQWLSSKGITLSSKTKILIGFLFQTLAVGTLFILQMIIDNDQSTKISCFWQLMYTVNQAISESIVGVVVLEYAYEIAPSIMKSSLIAISFLFKAVGSALGILILGLFNAYLENQLQTQFLIFTGLMAFNTLMYYLVIVRKAN